MYNKKILNIFLFMSKVRRYLLQVYEIMNDQSVVIDVEKSTITPCIHYYSYFVNNQCSKTGCISNVDMWLSNVE